MPALTPPPAIHMVKPYGLWSRPLPFSDIGVRPNSPPQTTSVWSSRPRRFRSLSRPATGWSMARQILAWFAFDVGVGVPPAARAAVELDEPHAALDQAAGQQAEPAEALGRRVVQAVEGAGLGGLARQVDGLGGLGLHAEGQLVALDPGVELGLVEPGAGDGGG